MEHKIRFNVNPAAETVTSIVILVIFSITVGIGICCILGGLALSSKELEDIGLLLPIPMYVIGFIIIVVGIINWAFSRIIINISRSLYNIQDAIRLLHKFLEEQNGPGEEINAEEE